MRQLNFGAGIVVLKKLNKSRENNITYLTEEDGINELPGAGPSGLQNIPKIGKKL